MDSSSANNTVLQEFESKQVKDVFKVIIVAGHELAFCFSQSGQVF